MDVILNNQPLSTLWSKAHQAWSGLCSPKNRTLTPLISSCNQYLNSKLENKKRIYLNTMLETFSG